MFIRISAAHNLHTLYKYVNQDVQKDGDVAIKEVGELGDSSGLFILDAKGNCAFSMNSKGMHHGTIGLDGRPMTAMYGTEKLHHYSGK